MTDSYPEDFVDDSTDSEKGQLARIQDHFHDLIRLMATKEFGLDISGLELPILTSALLHVEKKPHFRVPGMYGGFLYSLGKEDSEYMLVTISECRVCGGSWQRHEITAEGAVLKETQL
jgi:hypothetical protein